MSERKSVIIHHCERILKQHPRFLEIHCTRSGRSRGRKFHQTRSLVAFEGLSSVRDRTNRKHCPSHKIWSYKRGGRSTGVLLYNIKIALRRPSHVCVIANEGLPSMIAFDSKPYRFKVKFPFHGRLLQLYCRSESWD